MKRLLFTTIFLSSVLFSFSQNKKLTIEDAVTGQWRQFYPEHINGIQTYAEDNFTYVKDYKEIILINKKGISTKSLVSLEQINSALKETGNNEIKYFPYWDYSWLSANQLSFKANGNYYIYNLKNKKFDFSIVIPKEAKNIKPCEANNYVAYTIDNNLFFSDSKSKTVPVTEDANKGIVNGNSYTHRQEFGIDNGIFWSPSGNYIAFYRKDETMVADYPLVDITTRIATLNNTKYPMIGEKSEEVTLGIYNLKTGKTVFADVTDFSNERYLTSITWDSNEKYIYIGVLNRGQNHLKLNKYDASNGKFIKTLFEEKNDKYVEPEHQLIFTDDMENQFIWYSEKDGFNHLYLYDTEGKLIRQLTKGNWIVKDFLGFDSKNKDFFITATKNSPIENHLYKVNFTTGAIKKLTNEKGVHNVVLSNSKKYIFDSYSNTKTPNNNLIIDNKGKVITNILSAKNPLTEYNLGEITLGTIKAADGKTDLHYRLITPPDFDKTKKYPVVVYVYGGPHAQLVTNSWLGGARLWNFYMAQKGYIMFTIDNRGSDNRGFEFESIIHRQCGQEEMKDQMKGIDFLKKLSYVDSNRIGVHGWSYGGFMTTSLMINYPETFKTGVAGGPVIDWKYYEVMYGERYMDTPEENPEGFEKTSLLNKAGELKGRLLMIHGYQDPVVVPQNSIDFIKSCINAGTDIDYFIYPESEHNMRGKARVHLMKKITRYFDDFL
ncbi:MAG: S9 family peptidase [Bacteroidales bacterium]|nr:S9 family peptidase [Bacteroidales bacterium]